MLNDLEVCLKLILEQWMAKSNDCILLTSKGMCEQVIMNEEFENEKAIKHRRRLIGKYSVDR